MRSRTIFTAALVAIFASLAFGQADSCNMTLVDEWTTIVDYDWSGIDMVDDYVIAALGEKLMVLELSATGELTPIDSMFFRANQVAHKDSIVFVSTFPPEGPTLYILKISDYGILESMDSISMGTVANILQVQDTLLYTYFGSTSGLYQIYNISSPLSPSLILVGNFGGPTTPTAFWGEYPYLYNGGYTYIDATPHAWECGYFNIMDVSDTESPFISYSACSEFGTFYYPSHFDCMSKKDSLLYIGGRNRFIEVYDIALDGSDANFVCSYGDSTLIDYAHCLYIENNLMFTGCDTEVRLFDISDPTVVDVGGYYSQDGELEGATSKIYKDLCVKDSFIVALGVSGLHDTVFVIVLKFSAEGMGNCEIDFIPENLELKTYPNPFNSHCSIDIPEGYSASIYNIQGRCVVDAIDDLPCINGSFVWDASNESTGVYLVVLRDGDRQITRKIVYTK